MFVFTDFNLHSCRQQIQVRAACSRTVFLFCCGTSTSTNSGKWSVETTQNQPFLRLCHAYAGQNDSIPQKFLKNFLKMFLKNKEHLEGNLRNILRNILRNCDRHKPCRSRNIGNNTADTVGRVGKGLPGVLQQIHCSRTRCRPVLTPGTKAFQVVLQIVQLRAQRWGNETCLFLAGGPNPRPANFRVRPRPANSHANQ